jgi:hypothetical protein
MHGIMNTCSRLDEQQSRIVLHYPLLQLQWTPANTSLCFNPILTSLDLGHIQALNPILTHS